MKGNHGRWGWKGVLWNLNSSRSLRGPYILHQGVWIPTRGQEEPPLLDEESHELFLRARFNQQQGTESTRRGTVETDKAKMLLGGKRRASRNESPGPALGKALCARALGSNDSFLHQDLLQNCLLRHLQSQLLRTSLTKNNFIRLPVAHVNSLLIIWCREGTFGTEL